MKVKDAIQELEKYDPELIISTFDEDYRVYSDNVAIEEVTLYTGEKRIVISKSLYPPKFFDQLKELSERDRQTNIIRALLLKYFKGENEEEGSEIARRKVSQWMSEKNPALGNLTPHQMIHAGRFEKLHNFVKTTLEENEREDIEPTTNKGETSEKEN
jgi:hypothetical protein